MDENIREFKGNCLYEFLNNYVVVDIETTGLSPRDNEITEIAAIRIRDNKIVDQYNTLIRTEEEIPEHIERLTGISNEMVKEHGANIETALIEFNKFIGDDVLIGHNVNFDINFLYDNCLKHLEQPLTNDFVDTLKISKNLIKDTYNWKLTTLAKKFNIDNPASHRALNDAIVTHELYKELSYINEHFLEIRMSQLSKTLKVDEDLKNKKISFKSHLKYIEEIVIEHILKNLNSKSYFYLSKNADILVVNDNAYETLQIPLDLTDPYNLMFNEWKIKAQSRIKNGTLKLLKESELCERLGIPILFTGNKESDESNPLFNKVCVFTGALERMSRNQASSIIESIGGIVGQGVTAKTNYLILGNNDFCMSIKDGKSSKHKKAEELQLKGKDIEIIPEDVFYEMIGE